MAQLTFNYPANFNYDLLREQLLEIVGLSNLVTNSNGIGQIQCEADVSLTATIQGVLNTHDENDLTEDQQIQEAASIAILQGKDYLRKQYLNPTPNLSTIYTTLSNAVSGNTYLQQIMDNQIAVYQLETGYDLSTITTNADRARYIECVRRVIALLT